MCEGASWENSIFSNPNVSSSIGKHFLELSFICKLWALGEVPRLLKQAKQCETLITKNLCHPRPWPVPGQPYPLGRWPVDSKLEHWITNCMNVHGFKAFYLLNIVYHQHTRVFCIHFLPLSYLILTSSRNNTRCYMKPTILTQLLAHGSISCLSNSTEYKMTINFKNSKCCFHTWNLSWFSLLRRKHSVRDKDQTRRKTRRRIV